MRYLIPIAALALAGCGPEAVRFIPPPPERMAAVPAPVIPPATTPCATDPKQLCNSDEEAARVLSAYDDALAKANAELEWIRNFFAAVPAKPK
jgi:hypothetical protein